MTISIGDTVPNATLLEVGTDGPAEVQLADKLSGRKVALFGLPGAFTGVCSEAHMPSFIKAMDGFKAKGVDEVICVSVNDPFVLQAWGGSTGAMDAGITLLGDASAAFIKKIGMDFTADAVGLMNRSKRFSAYVEDGAVKALNIESSPGECEISAGETLLGQI